MCVDVQDQAYIGVVVFDKTRLYRIQGHSSLMMFSKCGAVYMVHGLIKCRRERVSARLESCFCLKRPLDLWWWDEVWNVGDTKCHFKPMETTCTKY